jgi:hypothetical protein
MSWEYMSGFKKTLSRAFANSNGDSPFWRGYSSVLNIHATRRRSIYFEQQTPEKAISSDWEKVGGAVAGVIRKVEADGKLLER